MATRPIDVVDTMEQAINAHDLDGFVEFLSDEVTATTGPQTLKGPAQVREHFSRLITAFPDFRVEQCALFSDGEWVAHAVEASGTHDGPLVRPDGSELPPTGRQVRFDMCGLLRVVDGEVVEVHEFPDRLTMLTQLGAIPAPKAAETSAAKSQ